MSPMVMTAILKQGAREGFLRGDPGFPGRAGISGIYRGPRSVSSSINAAIASSTSFEQSTCGA